MTDYRLTAASEVVREAFPASLESVYVAVTSLGSPTLLTFALAVLYWVGDRRRETAAVVSYAFAAYGVVIGLKTALAVPRPPASVALIATDGYGFPSGHAIAAVVVYGGLAAEFRWLGDAGRTAATVAVVLAVALSRVVLGVHYLGDVLVGLAVGVVLLAGARRLTGGDPRLGFAAGVVPSLGAVAITGGGATALGGLGACVGGVLGTSYLDSVPAAAGRAERIVLAIVGVATVAVLQASEDVVTAVPAGAAVDDLVLVPVVLLLPAALQRAGVRDRLTAGRSESDGV